MTTLIHATMHAPIVGVVPTDPSVTMHALEMEQIVTGWDNDDHMLMAACGESVKILTVADDIVPWPPRVRDIAPIRRCLACHQATGRKKPRW